MFNFPVLNFPVRAFRLKRLNGKLYIWDTLRKKYLVLLPEEWVRQHLIQYLIQEKGYPPGLIRQEARLELNTLHKRADVVVFNREGKAQTIIECKAPHVSLGQETFDQLASYNQTYKASVLIISNGLVHYCCLTNQENGSYSFVDDIPCYAQ